MNINVFYTYLLKENEFSCIYSKLSCRKTVIAVFKFDKKEMKHRPEYRQLFIFLLGKIMFSSNLFSITSLHFFPVYFLPVFFQLHILRFYLLEYIHLVQLVWVTGLASSSWAWVASQWVNSSLKLSLLPRTVTIDISNFLNVKLLGELTQKTSSASCRLSWSPFSAMMVFLLHWSYTALIKIFTAVI